MLTCTQVKSNEILWKLKESINDNTQNCVKYHLDIFQIKFPGDILTGTWLGKKPILNINSLKITDNTIFDMYANGFNSKIFQNISFLFMKDLKIQFLRYGVFRYMTDLQNVILNHVSIKLLNLNVFVPNKNLCYLTIRDSIENELTINGGNNNEHLKALVLLIINQNNLPKTLRNESFNGLISLSHLKLNNNQIAFLPNGLFKPIQNTIQVIEMRNNQLKMISSDLFVTLLPKIRRIFLANNLFHCDENILSLKQLLIEYQYTFDKAICVTPSAFRDVEILLAKINVTKNLTSLPTNHSTQITSRSMTLSNPLFTKYRLRCKKCKIDIIVSYVVLTIPKRQYRLKVKLFDRYRGRMVLQDFTNDMNVFWMKTNVEMLHNSSASIEYGCFINRLGNLVSNRKINKNIESGELFTVCILPRNNKLVKPMNCFSFSFGLKFDIDNLWIPKKYQFMSIVMTIMIGLVIACGGIVIMIILSCQYPKFIDRFFETIHMKNNR